GLNDSGLRATGSALVGHHPLDAFTARSDYSVSGYDPYQYPVGRLPQQQHGALYNTATGAGRGLLGFLKMAPVVGNIINGFDFLLDLPKALRLVGNPTVPFQQKLKAGTDLLFHGAGM